MADIFSAHNKKLLKSHNGKSEFKPCNCRYKPSCPLNGNCRDKAIVYQATVQAKDQSKNYIGLCETEFKARFYMDYPNQILAVVVLSQHRVLPYKTFRPHATCDARCMGHIIRMWFAFSLMAQHLQFSEGAGPHLCMDEWNCSICRRLSLTQTSSFQQAWNWPWI